MKKKRWKIPLLFLPFRLLRSQQMNRSTEGCCLCLLCNTGCLLWKCKGEDEGRMEGEREGGMQKKKKKGIPSIPALSPSGPQANSTQSSEIEPSKSLAELIQSIRAQSSPTLSAKSQQGSRVGSPVKSPSPVWLNPVRLGWGLFYPVEAIYPSFLSLHTERDWLLTAASL